ncbi:dCTP deaminase, partial [candidate division WWE3 bacterium]|nr:dCTP deaminase [candidate division WWE3 bacterium]
MILTGSKIIEEVENEKIIITPFSSDKVTTNSYDLSLGETVVRYTSDVIDPRIENSYEEVQIPEEGMLLEKGM